MGLRDVGWLRRTIRGDGQAGDPLVACLGTKKLASFFGVLEQGESGEWIEANGLEVVTGKSVIRPTHQRPVRSLAEPCPFCYYLRWPTSRILGVSRNVK